MILTVSSMTLKHISAFPKREIYGIRSKEVPFATIRKSFCRTSLKMSGSGADSELKSMVRKIVPPMTALHHKGQCGRIGIIGGCKEYTGAPYFAGISSLKVGADLSHIFCTEQAAPVIKSYSPELIVHPVLDAKNAVKEVLEWLPRIHVLVIGPGLGRDESIFETVKEIIYKAKEANMPLVIDADGLFLVTQSPEIIFGYDKTILTPNKMELTRLYKKIMVETPVNPLPSDVQQLATQLGGVTIVGKGPVDIITNGDSPILCKTQGSNRRCGGQGDLLSGSLGTFAHWAFSEAAKNESVQLSEAPVIAGYAACFLTRECNRMAYETHKRSTTTSDMVACIGQVFDRNFEVD